MPAHPKPFSPPTEQPQARHRQPVYCVLGAQEKTATLPAIKSAGQLGESIAKQHATVCTLAYDGVSLAVATAAFNAGGTTIGISPARSLHEHTHDFHLPMEGFSLIVYAGMPVAELQRMAAASSDAIILVCGRIDETVGVEHDFMETPKPVAILTTGSGQTAEVSHLAHRVKASAPGIIFETKPRVLVKKLSDHLTG